MSSTGAKGSTQTNKKSKIGFKRKEQKKTEGCPGLAHRTVSGAPRWINSNSSASGFWKMLYAIIHRTVRCSTGLKDYGEATLAQNKIFNPIKPRTTAVICHGITTRRAEQRKTYRCRRTRRAVPCSRRCPSRPRTFRPSAPDVAPPRYPHVQGGSAAYRTARFATAAWRGREVSGYSFDGGKLG
jgi:hypothetical protein